MNLQNSNQNFFNKKPSFIHTKDVKNEVGFNKTPYSDLGSPKSLKTPIEELKKREEIKKNGFGFITKSNQFNNDANKKRPNNVILPKIETPSQDNSKRSENF